LTGQGLESFPHGDIVAALLAIRFSGVTSLAMDPPMVVTREQVNGFPVAGFTINRSLGSFLWIYGKCSFYTIFSSD
jgi:hypothetical protein